MLRRMGPLKQLLGPLPGVGSMLKDVHIEGTQLDKVNEAMISPMTGTSANAPNSSTTAAAGIASGSGVETERCRSDGHSSTW